MASKARAKSRGKIPGKSKKRRTPKPKFNNREAAIIKNAKKSKAGNIKELQQSVGSLDRRINTAIDDGKLDVAKDLRSRKNKFTTDLGIARALELKDGVARSKDGKILRSSTTGQPLLTSRGRDIFDQTKDLDFVDPTRRLQNVAPDAYKKMYPYTSAIAGGLPSTRMAKELFNVEDKDIPYRYPGTDDIFGEGAFPAQRYPLDYMGTPDAAPVGKVTISDLVISDENDDQEGALYDPVPYIHPAIDPNKRTAIMNEGYGDIIESGRQDFDTLDAEFQKNKSNREILDGNGDLVDPVKIQELLDLIAAEDAEKKAFAEERQNVFYNKGGINVGGEGNLSNAMKEIYNLGGYLSGGQALNKYALEPAANAVLGEPPMVPIDQSEFNPDNIDYSQIIETLKGPGFNLKDDMIQELLNSNPDLLNDSNLNSTVSDFYSNR